MWSMPTKVPQVYTLVPRDEANKKYATQNAAMTLSAQAGSAYGFKLENFLNMWGMPAGRRPTASCRPMI